MAACPMTVANQYGWEICAPTGFTVVWNGGANRRCLAIVPDDEHEGSRIISHFGGGIFTYSFPAIFKTEPGYDLWVQGPANYPVGGATAMSGIQESDWLLTQSAIHWKMAEPNRAIRFSKGDPLAQVFPIRRGELEAVEPELRSIEDEPEVKAYMEEWMARRGAFNKELKQPDSDAARKRWPGNYRRGADVFGDRIAPADHRAKMRVKPFRVPRDEQE